MQACLDTSWDLLIEVHCYNLVAVKTLVPALSGMVLKSRVWVPDSGPYPLLLWLPLVFESPTIVRASSVRLLGIVRF